MTTSPRRLAPLLKPSGPEPALLAEMLLAQAILHEVTDLHLLPAPEGYEARVRKDGQLLSLASCRWRWASGRWRG